MTKIDLKKVVENLIDTFIHAGKISLELRKKGLTKEIKSDNTPVSNGDLEVNKIITNKIIELTPNIPIISEETSDYKSKKNLQDFWLIDPIDGTYDYINNLDEFTINAGLIIDKKPVAGLIYAPAKKRMFFSYGKELAFELINKKNKELKNFWLIDPIDGTYDYINNGDEFTLNAALIINNKPELGLIYAPAKKRLFYSYGPGHSFEIFNNN